MSTTPINKLTPEELEQHLNLIRDSTAEQTTWREVRLACHAIKDYITALEAENGELKQKQTIECDLESTIRLMIRVPKGDELSLYIDKKLSQIGQLEQERDLYSHDLKQVRDALQCDGSDLPQLISKIGELREANRVANALIGSQADETDKIVNQLRAQVAALQNIPIPPGCITEGEEMYIPLYSRRAVLEQIEPVIEFLVRWQSRGIISESAAIELSRLTAIKEQLEHK